MELTGVTWIVTADARQARIFEERVRAGDVRELPDLRMAAAEREESHRHKVTVHNNGGSGRHGAGEHDPALETERRFMREVAEALDAGLRRKAYETLVLMAPPRALGLLRAELSPAVARAVEAADPHDRIHDHADAVREHLRDARARA